MNRITLINMLRKAKNIKKNKKHNKKKEGSLNNIANVNDGNSLKHHNSSREVTDELLQKKRASIHRPTKTSPQFLTTGIPASPSASQPNNVFVATLPMFANMYSNTEKKNNKIVLLKPTLPRVASPPNLPINTKARPLSVRGISTPVQFQNKQVHIPNSTREVKYVAKSNWTQNPNYNNINNNGIQEEKKNENQNVQSQNDIPNNNNNNINNNNNNNNNENQIKTENDNDDNNKNNTKKTVHWRDIASQIFSSKGRIDNFKELQLLTSDDQ